MTEVFVDAWYYIALIDRFDSHHHRVRRLAARIPAGRLVTHEAVLTEVLAYFSSEGSQMRSRAVRFARAALQHTTVLPSDTNLFVRALDHYAARLDKGYSLVDCMSMMVMRDRSIRQVLSNDRHFAQDGFTVVNE
jgi:predicted nucleic acid-binding protein